MYQFGLFMGEWLIRLANRQRIIIETIEMSDSHIAPPRLSTPAVLAMNNYVIIPF
jgi:hypothetical protein